MTKKDCFFVWRGWSGLKLLVGMSRNSRMSRLALEVAIMDLDPFQHAAQREWRSARDFLNRDREAVAS